MQVSSLRGRPRRRVVPADPCVGMNCIKPTRPLICYHNHHLRRPDIDIIEMDDIRKSLSKVKKRIEHRLGDKKRAPERAGANAAGEKVGSSASLDPHVSTSGHNEEGSGVSIGVSQVRLRDPSPHPGPMLANEGHRGGPQRSEVDVEEKGLDDAEIAAGGGSCREDKRAYSPLPITLIPHKQEPDGTWALSLWPLCLIIRLGNTDTSAVPDHLPKGLLLDENAEPNVTTNEKKSSWKSTAFATVKFLLRGVRDSADAFGPLKSVAGCLCFILENCQVRPSPRVHRQNSYRYPSE